MSSLQIAYNNSAVTQIGNVISGTAFNTGFRVSPAGSKPSFDMFVTGTETIGLNGGYYGATGELTATLMDTSGVLVTGIGTNPISPTFATHVFTVQSVTYFSGLNPATTYWLRIIPGSSGNQIVQSDTLVQLSSAATTPSVSTVTGYNPSQIYSFGSNYDGVIDIHAKVGMEGEMSVQSVAGELVAASGNALASAYGYNGGKLRFKASCTNIYIRYYNPSANNIHLQSVALNGSSGTPTPLATLASGTYASAYGPWVLLASGLSSAAALYEIVINASASGGVLLAQIMTSGGTGIDTSTTTAALTRAQFINTTGDSIMAQDYPAGTYPWVMSTELISQSQNVAVLNAGVDGESLVTMAASAPRITTVTTGPVPTAGIIVHEGINDIKAGSPPSVATLSASLGSFINQVRAKGGGWATVPIWVEGIFPCSVMTYAAINAYIKGAGGFSDLVNQFRAGTAAGQSPASPDLNVHFVDVDGWNLGGIPYKTGGAFDGTNYSDGLHPNTLGAAIIKTQQLAYLSPALSVFRSSSQRYMRRGTRQTSSN